MVGVDNAYKQGRRMFLNTLLGGSAALSVPLICARFNGKKINFEIDPLDLSDERRSMTKEYSNFHYCMDTYHLKKPKAIVIHATSTESYQKAHNMFFPESLIKCRNDIREGGRVNISAHYIVDRDGIIYQQMPLDFMCRHAIGYNWTAIGVENISTSKTLFTDAQIESNIWLVEGLLNKMESISTVFAHKDYYRFPQSLLIKAIGDPTYSPRNWIKADPFGDDYNKVMNNIPNYVKKELASRETRLLSPFLKV